MPTPKLPARKAGGKRVAPTNGGSLPILSAQELELDDGTRIPVKIPEGMPPQQAQALLEYLKANPEAAKEGAAQQPGMADKYQALKDDPDLKHVFDDVVKNGPSAFQKYWDDVDLMAKV
ncbi:ANK_REP_REGION domain-containing protein [Haematococcus lacustris]|uniref:ANK_REP_REGION domain-containing protein n=1 Tax=Haematococcus lacustris TaxID=44745 RepID=A0A6A0A6J5_HAELA|nr:ANK_REP_REGION domain-containing protein [Haematococcus lacustris]